MRGYDRDWSRVGGEDVVFDLRHGQGKKWESGCLVRLRWKYRFNKIKRIMPAVTDAIIITTTSFARSRLACSGSDGGWNRVGSGKKGDVLTVVVVAEDMLLALIGVEITVVEGKWHQLSQVQLR